MVLMCYVSSRYPCYPWSYIFLFLAKLHNPVAKKMWLCVNWSWQLSKKDVRWPVWHGHMMGSWSIHRGYAFFEVLRWQVTSSQLTAGWLQVDEATIEPASSPGLLGCRPFSVDILVLVI